MAHTQYAHIWKWPPPPPPPGSTKCDTTLNFDYSSILSTSWPRNKQEGWNIYTCMEGQVFAFLYYVRRTALIPVGTCR